MAFQLQCSEILWLDCINSSGNSNQNMGYLITQEKSSLALPTLYLPFVGEEGGRKGSGGNSTPFVLRQLRDVINEVDSS